MTFAIEMHSATGDNSWKSWTELTVHGLQALSQAHYSEAAHRWLVADTKLSAEIAFDPLLAASRTNVGVASLLQGREREADRAFGEADGMWLRVIAGIRVLEIPATGASSSFHFRLAAKSPEVLISARRHSYRRLADAALAITRFNRALVSLRNLPRAIIGERVSALKEVLSQALGKASPEVRLLLSSCRPADPDEAFGIYAAKLSDVVARKPTLTAAFSDACAKLEIATALTMLLAPSVLISAKATESHLQSDRPARA